MSLNPVQFGAEVIDQFGRFLMTSFPIADPDMEAQVREHLRHDVGGKRLIAHGPFAYLNRPFEQGPSVAQMVADPALGLHPALAALFPYDSVHKHQEEALKGIKAGRHTIVATGTGSGKTEAFLLPIFDHCLRLRDQAAAEGVVALLVYPMNALADDQLRRLRRLLAGTRITFGRYTGVTPEEGDPEQGRMPHSRAYTPAEQKALDAGREEDVPIPWEECFSRKSILDRRPRILLTNYSQLEYLLLRDKDLALFRDAPLRFQVLDEVHTYTGAVGSEVACLIRRLRDVAGKKPADVVCIGTSATVQESSPGVDAAGATRAFAVRLFGLPGQAIDLVTERYKRPGSAPVDAYVPQRPAAPRKLLEEILEAARVLQLMDDLQDLTPELLALTERLCGRPAPAGATLTERAWRLLSANHLVFDLGRQFHSPALLSSVLPHLRARGRAGASDDELTAEILAYLTLGALVHRDGEPLLRPKLHYFVQGYQGLACSLEPDGRPRVTFDASAGHDAAGARLFPLVLCRSCGQHYLKLVAEEPVAMNGVGVRTTRSPDDRHELEDGEGTVYLTNRLVGHDEDQDQERYGWLCRVCGALHDAPADRCGNAACAMAGTLVRVIVHEGDMKTCLACSTAAKGYEEIVTAARSSEVADVNILAQSMLAGMPEESFQKLLIFTDNRQDAAFQAGWMEERSRRYRLRHLLFSTLEREPDHVWSLEKLTERLVDLAKDHGIIAHGAWDLEEDNITRVRWFLLQEFASTGQRRNSLETLGLARVLVDGLDAASGEAFLAPWAGRLGTTAAGLLDVVRLILDYYRRRGIVSDPLLCQKWTYQNVEVRKGLVASHDQYRPQALVFSKASAKQGDAYLKAWVAANGRSGAQDIVRRAIPGLERPEGKRLVEEFLQDAWSWLQERGILVSTQLVYKKGTKTVPLDLPAALVQISVAKLGFQRTDERQLCPSCRRSQGVSPPSGICPEYGCTGTLERKPRDPNHFDVHQYTRSRFVPLKTWEHSAQIPKEKRQEVEREFKKESGGRYNCLVATPTLEMGVDIGRLEMLLLRNVPPTPANYAQRAGRAGRRHRIAVVFTYCQRGPHDRYFFEDPRAMIAGEIRVPAFSMRNEPLIRKHVHSAVLTGLRALVADSERHQLELAFPSFVDEYFCNRIQDHDKWVPQYLSAPRDVSGLDVIVKAHRPELLTRVERTFQQTWPVDEAPAVASDALAAMVDAFVPRLRQHIRKLFEQVQAFRNELKKLREKEDQGYGLTDEEKARRVQYQRAVDERGKRERQENYTLSYLSMDGFFPGYAMARESVAALSLDPYLELSRPAAVALRELTPANFVYANKNIFRVTRLNLHGGQGDRGDGSMAETRQLLYDPSVQRVFEPALSASEGGHGSALIQVTSFQLTDVEMRRKEEIHDNEPARRRIAFVVCGSTEQRHGGGQYCKIGVRDVKLLNRQLVRLVNLGQPQKGAQPITGFPLCSVCGATRSPSASAEEMQRFREEHQKIHGSPSVQSVALHVEIYADTLRIEPFAERADAINLREAIRVGARRVLDMGTTEIEGFVEPAGDAHGGQHALVLYDPMPGGSGFLQQILQYWEVVCDRAREALENCPSGCSEACYSCLKHFRNQNDHPVLNRHTAIQLLVDLGLAPTAKHDIEPIALQNQPNAHAADSDAETDFAAVCVKHGMPIPPTQQFKVDLGGTDYTVADWAWPEKKILVFIDGTSTSLHGDPEQAKKDKLKRAKARMKGYQVVVITNPELKDDTAMSGHFQEIAVYLEAS